MNTPTTSADDTNAGAKKSEADENLIRYFELALEIALETERESGQK